MSYYYAIKHSTPLLGNCILMEYESFSVEVCDTSSKAYHEIIDLRKRFSNGPSSDEFDEQASHYALKVAGRLIVALRVSRAHLTTFEGQMFYPEELLINYQKIVGSAGRLCADLNFASRLFYVKQAIATAWAHQVHHGARIDVINARQELAAFYTRMGYTRYLGSSFQHSRTGKLHDIYYIIASPNAKSYLRHAFRDVDPISIGGLTEWSTQTPLNTHLVATREAPNELRA